MKIGLGSDHGGFSHKEGIKKHLELNGFEVVDYGCFSEESVDYNGYALDVANAVASKKVDKGILVCGTGIGMSIQANKVNGVRAALVHDLFTAEATRLHNNSNVLAMGGRVISLELALKIVDIWVNTEFSNEDRHNRRINRITESEEQ
ncbi:ribose 5-phosphate isomerase B [Candidatus Izimaplasma sp. ZiA1]|uniref:ribose 5-phosphate isomerase B n=1 Tax=Candidatus Izimoplasma sp. ZiA1 TaxID=2024899 RepID=UPI00196A5CFA